MDKKLKMNLIKYALVAAPFLFASNSAKATNNRTLIRSAAAYDNGGYNLSLHAGFIYVLPNAIDDKTYDRKTMSGFNGGGFIELGGAKWYKLGNSNVEFHFEPFARFETVSLNTYVYSMNNDYNIVNAKGGTTLPHYIKDYPYERVQNFTTTGNVNIGLGYNGFTVEVQGGLGFHADTKKQHGIVMALGAGLGARINDHIKIRAGYRANANIFNNFGSPSTVPLFRHDVEIGIKYLFGAKNNAYRSYTYNHYRGRRR